MFTLNSVSFDSVNIVVKKNSMNVISDIKDAIVEHWPAASKYLAETMIGAAQLLLFLLLFTIRTTLVLATAAIDWAIEEGLPKGKEITKRSDLTKDCLIETTGHIAKGLEAFEDTEKSKEDTEMNGERSLNIEEEETTSKVGKALAKMTKDNLLKMAAERGIEGPNKRSTKTKITEYIIKQAEESDTLEALASILQ